MIDRKVMLLAEHGNARAQFVLGLEYYEYNFPN